MSDRTEGIVYSTSDLPNEPAVYAMYGGKGRSRYVAYVGLGTKLKGRVEQHLIRRDSSVTTGVSAVSLNPDFVTEVQWWTHSKFTEQETLEAAELIAFDVLEPALRSRGGITDRAKRLYEEASFRDEMMAVFNGEPDGRLLIRNLPQAWDKIQEIDERLRKVEDLLSERGET